MSSGYVARLARVDLDTEKCSIVEVDRSQLRTYIGGSGVGARLIWEETTGTTDAFDPDNLVMFMIGPLSGRAPQSSRTIICGLSPANNAWGESAMGGTWGAQLAHAGFMGVVVSGRARRPVYIYINDDEISVRDASHVWGQDSYEAHDSVRAETDPKASILTIGRAGERLVRFACVIGDGKLGRAGARNGMGAVMGSKNLKAVAVRGTRKLESAEPEKLRPLVAETTKHVVKTKDGYFGPLLNRDQRVVLVQLNKWGTLGARNGALGRWDSFVEHMRNDLPVGEQTYCPTCAVSCIESHKHGDTREMVMHTIMALGVNCLIDDVPAFQKAYDMCNRYGMDVISAGYVMSFAMECYEKGLITKADTGGVELTWGNAEAMLEMVRQMGECEGLGKVLAQGALRAAQQIGGNALDYAMQVKGLEVTFWDGRVFPSLALGYATGNRGASHYESPGHILERKSPQTRHGLDIAELGYPKGVNRLSWENKADVIRKMQDSISLINSLVVCQYSYQIYGVRLHSFLDMWNAVTGSDLGYEEFVLTGERIFNLKRLINQRHGYTGKDDTLPKPLLRKMADVSDEEQIVPRDEAHFKELLQGYYAERGWDRDGAPTAAKLREVGLA